jgi:hypothetical protein
MRLPPAALLVLLAARPAAAADPDVVVYGGSAGGVVAAVAAAREGKQVLLLEPGRHVGGMVTGGLGATDFGKKEAVGGYAREVFDRVRDYYTTKYGADSPQAKECDGGFKFEPHVAERVLLEMLNDARVTVRYGVRLAGVVADGPRLRAVRLSDGRTFAGTVFVDASYEGDLLAMAKVTYHVGREGRDEFGESLAGVVGRSPAHQWPLPVPALRDGKPLPLVQADKYDPAGTGDRKVQAYNFRLCMTDRPENRVAWPKPADYDPARYELLARYLERRPNVKLGQLCNPVRMPNGKTDTNNNGPISTDHIGANWDYPEADWPTRDRIREDHVRYTQGFFYFLAHDPRVPPALRDEANRWGLAKDEFTDSANWPHQLYVREARRMRGAFVMTQRDVMTEVTKPDSVALGSYNTDSHHVQRLADKDGNAVNEGDFQVGVRPYAIPYRSLTPKAGECPNLLVPVCVSASHVAYGTVRMEPVYMALGHACGVAAALAADRKAGVQDVPYEAVRAKLVAQKAVLDPTALPVPKGGGGQSIDAAKLDGVVVDDTAATVAGDWQGSAAAGRFVGAGYLHDRNEGKGAKSVRFAPKLPAAGRYEVYLFYAANANRAADVPVVVRSADGEKTVTVDQRMVHAAGGQNLGTFRFDAGSAGWVEVRTAGTTGYVIADAVRFVPVK